MALQGSLDDVALVDVLALLSSTCKTGELRIDGGATGGGRGRLWLLDGLVVAAESSASSADDAVDGLFELLRLDGGTFVFTAGARPARASAPREVGPLVDEASARLEEWRAIAAVVPSLATRAALVAEVEGPSVTVDAASWPVLVAVAHGGTVRAVADALGLGEFGACRAVKALVDAGLVRVEVGDVRATPPAASATAPALRPADPDPVAQEPAASERFAAALREVDGDPRLSEAEVDAADEAGLIDENGDPTNRTMLLKFLSSVRS